jgi:BirA family biotin operon repressor/biotin-[acetyl-CoA-carboxylase] ligase
MTSDLSPASFGALRRGRFGVPYLYVAECRSTQELLRDTALPEGAVAVAEHQTAGRGRLGRTWEDAAGSSLLCSVLLRPHGGVLPQLSLVAALATAEAVEELTQQTAQVKWPNDVLVAGRKVAGILLEHAAGAVVAGIGVNVGQEHGELPQVARTPAGSLRTASGRGHDRGALLAALLFRLEGGYAIWEERGLAALRPALEARNALKGVRVHIGDVRGVCGSIAPGGGLEIVTHSGGTAVVESGEVELAGGVDVDE